MGSQTRKPTPAPTSTTPVCQLLGSGNAKTRNAGRSSQQNAATRRSTQREERVTVQGPMEKQQPDGMSHRGAGCFFVGGRGRARPWRLAVNRRHWAYLTAWTRLAAVLESCLFHVLQTYLLRVFQDQQYAAGRRGDKRIQKKIIGS